MRIAVVPAENLLGAEGDGFMIAMTSLDGGRIGISSQSLGVAQACLDAAVSYANERVQFGKTISQFQGLRWMIADMATEIEAARLLTFNAAAMRDRGENYSAAASMAKVFASEMANRTAYQALQIHGGYGYIQEYPVERYYRDARVFTLYEGTSEIQRTVNCETRYREIDFFRWIIKIFIHKEALYVKGKFRGCRLQYAY